MEILLYYICICLYGQILGVILVIPSCLFFSLTNTLVALSLYPFDIFHLYSCIIKTPRWGPNVKISMALVSLFIVIIWIPLVFILSFILSFFIGLFGPLVFTFTEGKSWIYGGVYGTIKTLVNMIKDFKHQENMFQGKLIIFQEDQVGPYFEIKAFNIFIGFIFGILMSSLLTISFLMIAIITGPPVTFRGYYKYYYYLFFRNPCQECFKSIIFIGLILSPIFILACSMIFPCQLIVSPLMGIWCGCKCAIHANETDILTGYYEGLNCIIINWNDCKSYAFGKQFGNQCCDCSMIHRHDVNLRPEIRSQLPNNNIQPTQTMNDISRSQEFDLPSGDNNISEVERIKMDYIWEQFFHMTEVYTKEALHNKLITSEEIEEENPSLFLGMPSIIPLRMIFRSLEQESSSSSQSNHNTNHCFITSDGTKIHNLNRPSNFIADPIWQHLITIYDETKQLNLTKDEKSYMYAFLLTCNDDIKMKNVTVIPSDKERLTAIHRITSKCQSMGINISRMNSYIPNASEIPKKLMNIMQKANDDFKHEDTVKSPPPEVNITPTSSVITTAPTAASVPLSADLDWSFDPFV